MLRLQALAGNQAVAEALADRRSGKSVQRSTAPIVQRARLAGVGDISQAVDDLNAWLVALSPRPEDVLMTLLLQRDHRAELVKQYQTRYQRALTDDLGRLSRADALRGRRYLEFGQLRQADKIYLAIHGKFTDEVTLLRVMPEIHANRARSEADFASSYGSEYGMDYKLPDGSASRIAGAVMAETLWATFAQRFKIAAILAFGAPRAADEVKIATVMPSNDTNLLFKALQREDPTKIAADFEASYGTPITSYLSRETSFHTKLRALMFFDENVKPEDRLIRTVQIATSGYTTADTDFIFDAVTHATDAQIDKFKAALATQDRRLKDLDATFGGLNKQDRDRLNALLGIGAETGMMADPAVRLLRSEGGNDGDSTFETLRNATGRNYTTYRQAYADGNSPLRRYVDQLVNAPQKGWLSSYVFADLRFRLNYVMTNPGHDDYIFFLLTSFADSSTRLELATDAEFGARFGRLATATQNKILILLEPDQLTPQQRAVWLDVAVKRETSSGAGTLTGAAEALQDENRELQAAIARGGRNPTPEQQEDIDRLLRATKGALDAFIRYRDELEAAIAGAVELAAGILAGVLTGGVASVEFALAALTRAAVANAMAKVVSNKLAKGDRFDTLGADGAQAFVTGAVDGMLNVIAPAVGKAGKAALAPAVEESAVAAARLSAPQAFRQFAAGKGQQFVEGTLSGGVGSAVDTMTRDETWAQGFDRGMRRVLANAMQDALAGGGMAVLPAAISALVTGAGGLEAFEALVDAMPETEEGSLLDATIEVPASASRLAQAGTVQRQANWGDEFERHVDRMLWTQGLEGMPRMSFVIPGKVKSNQGLDRIGVAVVNGQLHVYHFEMKWRNPPKSGKPLPEVKLPRTKTRGVQTSREWTAYAINELCDSTHPSAMAARDALRVLLPSVAGRPRGTALTIAEVQHFLRSNMNAARVVVTPVHVNVRKLWKQLAALARWDHRTPSVKRVTY